jgi:hypothetical protein
MSLRYRACLQPPLTLIAVQLGRVRELLCKILRQWIVCQLGQIDKSDGTKIRSDEKRMASIGASSDCTHGAASRLAAVSSNRVLTMSPRNVRWTLQTMPPSVDAAKVCSGKGGKGALLAQPSRGMARTLPSRSAHCAKLHSTCECRACAFFSSHFVMYNQYGAGTCGSARR